MPNPFFRFKQFTVFHDQCAMKVGTDGVLLGAWTRVENAKNALDIGAGSGLISLMIAQRNPNLFVHAIDIDTDAIKQTRYNVEQSSFSNRITFQNIALTDFVLQTKNTYDTIVSNPPFFIDSLKSPDKKRTIARHTDTLIVDDLVENAVKLLADIGSVSLIYPIEYKEILYSLAKKNNLFITRSTLVYPTPASAPKRILIEMSKGYKPNEETHLVIEVDRHVYSEDFINLLRNFYLKF